MYIFFFFQIHKLFHKMKVDEMCIISDNNHYYYGTDSMNSDLEAGSFFDFCIND